MWEAASGLHLQAEPGTTSRGERGPHRQHQQVTSYLVKFFYPPDQVGVTGGVLEKDVIWNTAKRQSTRVRRRLADEHFLCLSAATAGVLMLTKRVSVSTSSSSPGEQTDGRSEEPAGFTSTQLYRSSCVAMETTTETLRGK